MQQVSCFCDWIYSVQGNMEIIEAYIISALPDVTTQFYAMGPLIDIISLLGSIHVIIQLPFSMGLKIPKLKHQLN